MDQLEAALSSSKESIERMTSEKAALLEQIEAGEGANTALQQLQKDNVSWAKGMLKNVVVINSQLL